MCVNGRCCVSKIAESLDKCELRQHGVDQLVHVCSIQPVCWRPVAICRGRLLRLARQDALPNNSYNDNGTACDDFDSGTQHDDTTTNAVQVPVDILGSISNLQPGQSPIPRRHSRYRRPTLLHYDCSVRRLSRRHYLCGHVHGLRPSEQLQDPLVFVCHDRHELLRKRH